MKKNIPILIILFAAAILLFGNLSNQYLWQDEAETATLAKNTLVFGFPRAFDGKNLVNPTIRTGYGRDFGWRYHPWIQFYITAFSFLILGPTTFAARFPFALMGLVNILLIYILALNLTRQRFIANCSALLTTFSVPYLLLMRQCRYYAPAMMLILFILLFYHKFLKTRSTRDILLFSLGLTILCYTVHGMFIPVYAAIALHYMIFSFDRKVFPKMALAGTIVMVSVLPWFFYSNSGAHVAAISFERIWKNFEFQIRMINKYIFPLFFFSVAYLLISFRKKKWTFNLLPDEKNALTIIFTVIFASLAAFTFAEERNFRYLVFFIPLLAMIESMILSRLAGFNRMLLAMFLLLTVFTGIFNMGRLDLYFPKYIYEITHDYDGPIEGIVRFLKKNSDPSDTVKISYGDLPVMFYTDLKVDNSRVFDSSHMPEWIVFRRWWDGKELLEDSYFQTVKKTYKEHILDYPDIPWENRPGDMSYHKFSTDKEAPGVIVFERR